MAVIKINRRGQIQNRCSKLNSRMFSHRAYVKPDSIQNFLLTLRYDVAAETNTVKMLLAFYAPLLLFFVCYLQKRGRACSELSLKVILNRMILNDDF